MKMKKKKDRQIEEELIRYSCLMHPDSIEMLIKLCNIKGLSPGGLIEELVYMDFLEHGHRPEWYSNERGTYFRDVPENSRPKVPWQWETLIGSWKMTQKQ